MALKRTSYRQQLLAVQDAARILRKPELWEATKTLNEIVRLEEILHTDPDEEKVQEILQRLFVGS